jgi:hypothetical protein
MVRHARTIYVHNYALSFSQCGWPNRRIMNGGSNWPMMYVMWVIFKSCHYVDL